MKLLYLRYLQVISEYQSITKAAKVLHISQPSITYAMKELESEYKIKLFIRKSHGSTLTKEGEQFLSISKELLYHVDLAERKLHDISGRFHEIRMGITPMMSVIFFPQWYQVLRSQLPEIVIRRYEYGTMAIFRKLQEGGLDCAIVPDNYVNPEQFDFLKLRAECYVCCVGKQHALASRSSVSIEDLKDEKFVVLDSSYANNKFTHQIFHEYGLTPKIIMETTQFSTVKDMISSGAAISFAYQTFVNYHRDEVIGIPLDVQESQKNQSISLVWPRGQYHLNSLDKLISLLREKGLQ